MPRLPAIAIILSRYNESVTRHLRDGAVRAYVSAGGDERALSIVEAAGAFEVPVLVQEATLGGTFQGVVALGCIIKGETDHDQYLAHAVTTALMEIAVDSGVPVGLGVLTVSTIEQAVERSGGPDGLAPGNKGEEAMHAVLATLGAIEALARARTQPKGTGVRFALDRPSPDKGGGRGVRAPGGSAPRAGGKPSTRAKKPKA